MQLKIIGIASLNEKKQSWKVIGILIAEMLHAFKRYVSREIVSPRLFGLKENGHETACLLFEHLDNL